jgi:cystathionine beta-synthase
MQYAHNILETIGNTPLVLLNTITSEIPAKVLAKVESFNPGNSVKDRMAIKMIEAAEASGALKPGGTIVEGTSGNTGMGLALGAIVKGYKLICVSTDKQSKEKFDVLRAVGAEVIVCPTNVPAEHPESYYSVAKRLGEETPNSWYVNQYDNPYNTQAHYEQTGPEIWDQTAGKITHFVVGVGTGGTISGVGNTSRKRILIFRYTVSIPMALSLKNTMKQVFLIPEKFIPIPPRGSAKTFSLKMLIFQ